MLSMLLPTCGVRMPQLLQKAYYLSVLAPTIRQLLANPPEFNTRGTARGHIKALRSFKDVGFMDLSDGSIHGNLSVVFHDPNSVLAGNKYKVGQSVEVTGKWIESKGSQKFELNLDTADPAHKISVLGDVPEGYPIQKKRLTLQFLRSLPTLRHRTALLASVLRFRANVEGILGGFFRENDVVKVSPPLITSSDCEGAGEQFQVRPIGENLVGLEIARPKDNSESLESSESAESSESSDSCEISKTTVISKSPEGKVLGLQPLFFGKDAYLTVSTQLHLEVLALSLNRVWTLTPCFRAEDSNTTRHLSEFWMLEAELCYVTTVKELTQFVEKMIRHLVQELKNDTSVCSAGSHGDLVNARYQKTEVAQIETTWSQILSNLAWPSITYTEAVEVLNRVKYKNRLKNRITWGALILTEEEKWLAGEHYQSPVFITDYPKAQKPFYMLENKDEEATVHGKTVACFDLIVPHMGELVGGSLREHHYETLLREMKDRNMLVESMQWYLSTRENGSVPHGGFGMGFERLLAYLAGVENIRDISAFPRAPNVCAC